MGVGVREWTVARVLRVSDEKVCLKGLSLPNSYFGVHSERNVSAAKYVTTS